MFYSGLQGIEDLGCAMLGVICFETPGGHKVLQRWGDASRLESLGHILLVVTRQISIAGEALCNGATNSGVQTCARQQHRF